MAMESLISSVNAIAAIQDYRRNVRKECCNIARRMKLLLPLFEEVKESAAPLCRSVRDSFSALQRTLDSVKVLLELCHDGSKLYLALESDSIYARFRTLTDDLDRILDEMPYKLLDISVEVKEQVELMHQQLKRAKGRTTTQDVELSMDIMIVLSEKDDSSVDIAILERLAHKLQLQTLSELNAESRALKKFIKEKGAELGDTAEQMNYLLKKLKYILHMECLDDTKACSEKIFSRKVTLDRPDLPIPEDFLCPISLELMRNPVIVATGQTYERASIEKWWESGHRTCPKTQQVMQHLTLTPNYVLRSLITQWCETNNVQLPRRARLCRLARISKSSGFLSDLDELSSGNRADIDALVENLSCPQVDVQRNAARELRSLAKRNAENRIYIAEAGAVPLLIKLLYSTDLKTQEHAVTALLNLSIHENNKSLIIEHGALQPIVEVLKHGSMESRENSAAALFSLSIKEENKVTIGGSGAVPPLVNLLRDGTPRGKKDAATALFNLSMHQGNKARAVRAGIVPVLLELVTNERVGMVDEALTILAILATHKEGRSAIGNQSAIHTLVRLICSGSPRNKENAAAVLLALATNDLGHLLTALQLGVHDHLLDLVQNGTSRARRKAKSLLDLTKKSELISKSRS